MMTCEEIVDEFTMTLPNAGILPFNDVERASELDKIYERVNPVRFKGSFNPYFKYGNWFAAAIKRRRRAEIKASRPISVDRSFVLDLPIELLLEIFQFLHPMDLYSVIRSTKRMRSILLDRRTLSIWKEVFERCSDVLPRRPLDISEPQWASMLFGPATCDYCGRKGAMIDFHFRRRFCQCCMDDMYVEKSSIDVNCLGVREDVETFWKCIPPSYREYQRFYHNNHCRRPRYLTWDINKMITSFLLFNSRISSGILGISGDQCNYGPDEPSSYKGHKDNMKELIKRHASVLLRRGHDQVDLDVASGVLLDQYLNRERFKLNYHSYKQLALALLRASEAHKIGRLEKERRPLIFQRQKLVEDRYHTYQKTLPPTSWPNLPRVNVVYEWEPFSAFIASESNEVGVLPEEPVQSHLTPFLDAWMQTHQSNIYARLEAPYENMDLAVNVFVCASCEGRFNRRHASIPIGLKDLRSHFKCIGPQFGFRFSSAGRASALALVDLLGMDPKTATVNDLDARDARFFCEGCDISWDRRVLGRQALKWRECISHVIDVEKVKSHSSVTSWALLTAEATECIKRHEERWPNTEYDVWCCNHCPEHYDKATTKEKALRHAKDVHSIHRARVDVDVIYDRRKLISILPRNPVCVGLKPPEIYQCARCPDTINRLWRIDRLKPHLLDKHQITNPGLNDWRVVKIVERSVGPHSEATAYPQM
ncbi:uncharacterized protein LACBIDRAFT_304523 [Laccaria bicolor S238N-H82]|uniref:Predicted protein n=1 Tax=Laccaria bicolor (strain S238N-H82 / ATCC MYA-4686) TaxID=486041 RepID=B0DLU0_LACBS|nr:uncharacterized protein LACBIDRAFT_304523 [Laccaria bicolor S238N-H82]EDR04454.1 predicted protein [Laccaria bicolor S238N-H82]|eukprot:XP_001884973.1 predicted protein [Laccaria bicolor S238N-H82]